MALLDTAKNVLKSGIGMFVVGVALTFAAQLIAPALGLEIHSLTLSAINHSNPLWNGAFFGAFGAIHAVVGPVVDNLFGDKKQTPPEKTQEIQKSEERAPSLALAQEQTVAVTHCERVEAARKNSVRLEVTP